MNFVLCPGCGFHDLRVFWTWTWWSRRFKVLRGLKAANRAVVSNMFKHGLMLSTLKHTAKPLLIPARSRPHTQSCDIINQLFRQTNAQKSLYPYILWHIFQCRILLKSARLSGWNQDLISQFWFQVVDSESFHGLTKSCHDLLLGEHVSTLFTRFTHLQQVRALSPSFTSH